MTQLRVVCSRELPDADQHRRLCSLFDVGVRGDLAAALADADAAVVIRPATVTEAMASAAPRLRVVATVSSGTDHLDLDALERRGIAVVSGTGAAPDAVAEWVLWALVGMRRGLSRIAAVFASGAIDWSNRLDPGSRELRSATVGIVGYGNVGQAVARALEPFGPRILVFDPSAPELDGRESVGRLDELCLRSDAVTVHVPLSGSTRGLIGAEELRLLGPDGLLVNAARGEVVDQRALLEALRDDTLGGAAVDCFDPEPADPAYVAALVATGRALVTPHVAGASADALAELCRTAVDGIEAVLRGG